MSRYDPNAKCRKCGDRSLTTEYDRPSDRIIRRCTRCGYEWLEMPLDHPDKPAMENTP